MKLSNQILTIIFLLNSVLPLQAQVEDSIINKYLEKNRPAGFGPAYIVARTEADITNDGKNDILVLYFYEVGESLDRSGSRYLTLFKSGEPDERSPQTIALEIQDSAVFSKVEVEGQEIILSGKSYAPGDGRCCPSKNTTMRLVYEHGQLIKMSESP